MRFGFVTCVQLGLSCIEAIYEIGGQLDLVVTLEDDVARHKSGRVFLDDICRRNAVDLLKVRNINQSEAITAIREKEIDWLFIIGWSQVARQSILDAPAKGAIGMHPTLLPIGRGRAAIPWAILKGLDKTGVTMFELDAGIDTGPIIAQHEIFLSDRTDAGKLYRQVESAHVQLMRDAFPKLSGGTVRPVPQDECLATVWPSRRPEQGQLDLAGSVEDADRLVRAVTKPYPGAFVDGSRERMIIWRAERLPPGANLSDEEGPVLEFANGALRVLDWETAPREAT